MRVDARYATAVVNLLCIESFATKLAPEYNLLDASEGLLRAHELMGQRALAAVLPCVSPALAAARAALDVLQWRLPALWTSMREWSYYGGAPAAVVVA